MFFARPSLTHHQTGHAEWCCRQDNIPQDISRLLYGCCVCSLWTCSHLWIEQGANGGPANSGVLWKEQILGLLLGWRPSMVHYSSSYVKGFLLESHLCSGNWAVKHTKPPCGGSYGCVILEELYYNCKLTRLQVLANATSIDLAPDKTLN